jgi:hypothetical protein
LNPVPAISGAWAIEAGDVVRRIEISFRVVNRIHRVLLQAHEVLALEGLAQIIIQARGQDLFLFPRKAVGVRATML